MPLTHFHFYYFPHNYYLLYPLFRYFINKVKKIYIERRFIRFHRASEHIGIKKNVVWRNVIFSVIHSCRFSGRPGRKGGREGSGRENVLEISCRLVNLAHGRPREYSRSTIDPALPVRVRRTADVLKTRSI